MGLLSRLRDVFTSNAHAAIDKMENPENMLNQYLRDLGKQIGEAEEALVQQMAAERRLKEQLDHAEKMVSTRRNDAMTALRAGDEGLAARCVAEKQEWEERANDLREQYTKAAEHTQTFRREFNELKTKYDMAVVDARRLAARYRYSKALNRIQKTMSRVNADGTLQKIERMANRIGEMEAEARARIELRGTHSPAVDHDLKLLTRNQSVEAELASLKALLQPAVAE